MANRVRQAAGCGLHQLNSWCCIGTTEQGTGPNATTVMDMPMIETANLPPSFVMFTCQSGKTELCQREGCNFVG
jgi:hypothetical protein